MNYPRVASSRTVEQFRQRLRELQIELPVDERILSGRSSPLGRPMRVGSFVVGNRFCIHPMEGWDATADGRPSELTLRRWRRFGGSGAKLIWGGEAAAVRHDGRANCRQLCCHADNEAAMGALREELVKAHGERFGTTTDLLVGLQLTHSGRFSRPNDPRRPEPRIVYHHPLLDARLGIAPDDASVLLTDDDLRRLVDSFIGAARMAWRLGFQFVDIKHCHGYLGHELLSAYDRGGDFGGSFENRTRFLREIVAGIRAQCPGLMVGVRLSAFDTPPFVPSDLAAERPGTGIPMSPTPGQYPGFGCDRGNPLAIDLSETIRLLQLMRDELAIELVNLSAGSPYYNPHIQRPALYPPSDGYLPPEDPLLGCARQIEVVRRLRRSVGGLPMVGTAYSYFQEYLPHVAQAVVREGWVDFVGIGRMALSYPELPADVLQDGRLDRRRLCRTFSDCTSAPRAGLASGCYPLDPFYRNRPENQQLKELKGKSLNSAGSI
jgi:2,4-dienoyl-CoA reductase-like NADH-dependent reductase (Old Yellow Enzyme family)